MNKYFSKNVANYIESQMNKKDQSRITDIFYKITTIDELLRDKSVHKIGNPDENIYIYRFSPDGRLVFTIDDNNVVVIGLYIKYKLIK